MHPHRSHLFAMACLMVLAWLTGCDRPKKKEGRRLMMGSFASVSAYVTSQTAIGQALNEMNKVDRLMSHYDPESEISRLNRLAGKESLKVSPETLAVIQAAIRFGNLTGGAFDITVGPLVEAWGFFRHDKRIPELAEIQMKRPLVNYRQIETDDASMAVKLRHPGMKLDLGGIAKGYAVDLAAGVLKQHHVRAALVNLSNSTFFAVGHPPHRNAWKIGIRHPRKKDAALGTVSIRDEALATSADSEQFFVERGVRYGHILDPRTGYPVSNGIVSTTVVAPTGMEADALATAIFVLGPVKGMALIQQQDSVEAVIVHEMPTGELAIEVSPGLIDRFIPQE